MMPHQKKLNPAQEEAVNYNDGPLLIVAGAGTGKTTVITEKIAHVMRSELAKPEEILALTFTDKAAEEMSTRVEELVDIGYADMHISTFHRFCQRILEQHALDIGLPRRFRLLTETESWLLVHHHLDSFPLTYYRPLGNPTSHIHDLLRHFSKCKDELISPEEYLVYVESEHLKNDQSVDETEDEQRLQEIANAYQTYNQLLLGNNALDFGDLIFYTVSLLRKRPAILKRLQEQFRFILVDEFQDVNYAQYELVKLLVGSTSGLTVVGDDDQSIYAFRGASVSNILRFKEDFPLAKEIVLSENYRSAQEILDLAYASIQHNNPDRLEVKLGIDKRLVAGKQFSKDVHVVTNATETLDDEVRSVIQEITKLKTADETLQWDDIAILVRANNHAEPFLQGLEKAGIPYEFLAASGLYRQPIVVDCFNFLKAITDYHESLTIFRLLQLPNIRLSAKDLQLFMHEAKKKSITYTEALAHVANWKLSPEGIDVAGKLMSLLKEGRNRVKTEKPTVILVKFMEESGYLTHLTELESSGNGDAFRQIGYLRQFLEFISIYEQSRSDITTYDFVQYYEYVLKSGDDGTLYQPGDTPESVNVMTVHASKGLEFRYVFLINLVEERFPVRRRAEGIELPRSLIKEQLPEGDYHYQEERRLFYVAVTRAKERLYLLHANNYGGVRSKKVSRFLAELGLSNSDGQMTARDTKESLLNKQDELMRASVQKKHVNISHTVPATFSFSQIQTYETCPYKYKLAHIIKLPTKGSGAFSFGSTMHLTMQRFYERIQEVNTMSQPSLFVPTQESETPATLTSIKIPPLTELLDMFEGSWIDDWYESKRQREQYKEKGREILKLFYVSQEDQWTIPIALEQSFKIMVGGYKINGRIDRVDQQADGTLEIIDYKTGKSKETVVGDDKDQLLIYQIAASNNPALAHVGPVGKLTFYYLNDNLKTSFVGKEKEIVKLQQKLLRTLEAIHAGEFTPTPSSFVCSYCDYRNICEFRR